MTFLDKDYVIVDLSQTLIPDPLQEFSLQTTWKKILSIQEVNSSIQEKVKKWGVVYTVLEKSDLVLVSSDIHRESS